MMWHVVTGEYPPQPGGVSVYTRQIARGLVAAGDEVTIWAPPVASNDEDDRGIVVHRLPDRFGRRSFRLLDAELDRSTPARLLIQYVPHAFGWKGANLPFCRWVASRSRDSIWLMFHEVAFPFDAGQSVLRNALAAANRVMARRVVESAERIFISIPAWRPMIESLAGRPIDATWLPVPSGIAVAADAGGRSAAVRARVGGGRPIVGHFGTYPASIRTPLAAAATRLLATTDCQFLLIGPHGDQMRDELIASHRHLDMRVISTGALPEAEVSAHIAACDVMVQPYPDGISARRTSAMAALAHGVPMVSTRGWLTEAVWETSGAAALVDVDDPISLATEAERLLQSAALRERIAADARRLYDARFDLRHTIAILQHANAEASSRVCA
jgi:glycosyltransferase involved in cell wall biosynthesis